MVEEENPTNEIIDVLNKYQVSKPNAVFMLEQIKTGIILNYIDLEKIIKERKKNEMPHDPTYN